MNDIISITNLNYKNIINNLNLKIKDNSFITISGNNKSGKTVLIKLLSNEIKTENTILINNKYIEKYLITDFYKTIGYIIFSNKISYIFTTVEEELLFILDNLAYTKEERKKRYNEIIKIFNLKKYLLVNPNNLHRNLQIKLSLALATISKPKILLLDDICCMMTKKETKEIMKILNYFKEEERMTIVLSTNNLNETLYSDYLYILKEGDIELEGKPLEVLKHDNVINKLGLELPFRIDLSVKLKDYNLIDKILLDMDEMVNELWK